MMCSIHAHQHFPDAPHPLILLTIIEVQYGNPDLLHFAYKGTSKAAKKLGFDISSNRWKALGLFVDFQLSVCSGPFF